MKCGAIEERRKSVLKMKKYHMASRRTGVAYIK